MVKSKDKVEIKESVPNIGYFTLYRFASKMDIMMIVIAIISSIGAGVLTPYAVVLVAGLFESMVSYDKALEEGKIEDEMFLKKVHDFAKIYSLIGVGMFVGSYIGTALMKIAALNQTLRIRREYLKAALNQDLAYYDTRKIGDCASKMADDMIKLEEGMGDKVSSFVYSLVIAIGSILMALIRGWKLALLCLASTPVGFLLVGIIGIFTQKLAKREGHESGEASAIAEEVFSSIKTVYAFNGQQIEVGRYRKELVKIRKTNILKECCIGLSMGLLYLFVFCSYALSLYIGIYFILNDPEHYNADIMFSVFFGVMTGVTNFGILGSLIGHFCSARGSGAQIFQMIDSVPSISPQRDRGLKPTKIFGNVEFQNVVFFYPARPTVKVIRDVSFKINAGQSIALVGHSGCGKSTIIDLIARFYDVCEGSVRIDGHDVRDLSVQWLRAQIGLVGQQPVLFNKSVKENITFGTIENVTEEDVEFAAKQAYAHNFIIKLPQGYDTMLGELGATLSGGQRQRIAIARALIRRPRILLLDEATSALDTNSEALVQKALEKISSKSDVTTITVAHRLSTIRHVDVIYVMKDGVVVEVGSHEELVVAKGTYYDMLNAQGGAHVPVVSTKERDSVIVEEIVDTKFKTKIGNEDRLGTSKTKKLTICRVMKLNGPEWRSLSIGCISSFLIGFSMPLFAVIFGDLFGTMSQPEHLLAKVASTSILFVSLGIITGVLHFSEALCFGLAGSYLTERLRFKMFQHMLRQDISYYDDKKNSTGALCARLSSEATYVQGATGQPVGTLIQSIGSVALALTVAFYLEWRVALVFLAFVPAIILVMYYQGKITAAETYGNISALENSTKLAIECISNIRTVASLGREDRILKEYEQLLIPAVKLSKRSAHMQGLVVGMSKSVFVFTNTAALTYGGHLITAQTLHYSNLLKTTQSLQMSASQAQNVFTLAPDFQKGVTAASEIVRLLDTKPKIVDPSSPVEFKSLGDASMEKVEFVYPTRPEERVLRGIDLEIRSGKSIALVGPSGCGRSTVIALLERFYDPTAGVVALQNVPISKILVSDVRANYGLVSQEPVLFNRTIGQNISYGDNSTMPTQQDIENAAKEANIHSFITSLPLGYETNVGPKGVQLSGGQKQRLAIARALIRQPHILLLDEATSALDTESEKIVQEALERASAGRTCVTIAHRLSTIRDADEIYVFTGGRVVERGRHADLMELRGVYYQLHTVTA